MAACLLKIDKRMPFVRSLMLLLLAACWLLVSASRSKPPSRKQEPKMQNASTSIELSACLCKPKCYTVVVVENDVGISDA
jgi:hypothetical protein